MSPVPEKKTGKAGTVRRNRRGFMSDVAVDPMMDSLADCSSLDVSDESLEGDVARDWVLGVDVVVAGRRTDVMIM